jgi:hypothetical protein
MASLVYADWRRLRYLDPVGNLDRGYYNDQECSIHPPANS